MEQSIVRSFLEMAYVPLYAVTLIVAIWRYPKYFDTPLKFLPILFLYTFLNELLGNLIISDENIALIFSAPTDNNVIYNLYTIISYLYYYYIFWSFSKDDTFRKNILYGALVFLISCVINVFFQGFIAFGSQTLAYVVGGCVLLYCTICYLWHFYSIPEKFALKQNIIYWLSLGLSVFYMIYLPIKILRYYHSIHRLSEGYYVRSVHLSLILIAYTIYIIGFIKMKRPLGKTL